MGNGDKELMALIVALDGDIRLEMELGDAVGRFRARRDREIRDMQAAELLPLGPVVAAERLGVAVSTVYKMTHRHRRFRSTPEQAA
jgi:hypothetical protein